MLELPIADAASQLPALAHRLTETHQTAILMEDGRPEIAMLSWEMYEALLDVVRLPSDPHELLRLPEPERHQALAIAALLAERHYHTDPALTDHEAFAEEQGKQHDDLYADWE